MLTFRFPSRWLARVTLLSLLLLMLIPTLAYAVGTGSTLVLPNKQLWTLLIGALVPLFTYVLNAVGPWVSEPAKALVLVIVSAAAVALYTALSTSVLGFNSATLELVVTGIVGSLGAHHLLWRPSGISTILGAGSNRVAPKSPAKRAAH